MLSKADCTERIGRLIMPRLDVDRFDREPDYAEQIESLVQDSVAGGFCVFGGTAERVSVTLRRLHALAGDLPLLFSCDCEFGLPMRLSAGGTEFPDAMAIAKTGEPRLALEAGKAIAREMRSLGLGWNFAPVADVNSNPANPIINTRAFGDDPGTVAKYASEFMRGLQQGGVAATAKHFPGHGDTAIDSHRELPVIQKSWNEFNAVELPPFEALIRTGVDSVMTGHLAAPKLAEYLGAGESMRDLPATLSPVLTSALLRDRLGFEGVIVTDALEMHAITKHFGREEAAVQALLAGADMLLMPPDPRAAHAALASAVRSGRIPPERIEESIRRIEHMMQKIAIAPSQIDTAILRSVEAEHRKLADEIAERAIELSGTASFAGANVLVLVDDRPIAMEKVKYFTESIAGSFRSVTLLTTSDSAPESFECDENTIIAIFYRARGYVTEEAAPRPLPALVREVAEAFEGQGSVPRGLILFGSPYLDHAFQNPPGFILKTYSESIPSIRAVLQMLNTE